MYHREHKKHELNSQSREKHAPGRAVLSAEFYVCTAEVCEWPEKQLRIEPVGKQSWDHMILRNFKECWKLVSRHKGSVCTSSSAETPLATPVRDPQLRAERCELRGMCDGCEIRELTSMSVTLRHISTGPKTAIAGVAEGVSSTCNAGLHNVKRVSPEMIGYAVVQARTIIGTRDWTRRDGSYNFEDRFLRIFKVFYARMIRGRRILWNGTKSEFYSSMGLGILSCLKPPMYPTITRAAERSSGPTVLRSSEYL
ncbi:hypothetical protein B0H14DRAFT_2564364 [Mycena olivaceomarginata]|nr:hypothetical protein B0H14DRAFT_2564364 [Mycena olivaceomarginata]